MTLPPPFLTFEGMDYCGKTTQLKKTAAFLDQHAFPYVMVKEPGSTSLGGTLRRILKEPDAVYRAMNAVFNGNSDFDLLDVHQQRTAFAEMHLFFASRADFLELIVNPNLTNGKSVLADRGGDSTTAYQGGGACRGDREVIEHIRMNNAALLRRAGVSRGLTFLFDIPYATMLERAKGQRLDVMEQKGPDFFERVRATYLTLAREEPERITLIDGTRPADVIFTQYLEPHLKRIYNL